MSIAPRQERLLLLEKLLDAARHDLLAARVFVFQLARPAVADPSLLIHQIDRRPVLVRLRKDDYPDSRPAILLVGFSRTRVRTAALQVTRQLGVRPSYIPPYFGPIKS